MTTPSFTLDAPEIARQLASFNVGDASPKVPSGSLLARLQQAVAAVAAWPRRRAVLRQLEALGDRELADIGLERAQLHRVFDPGFARRR